MTLTALKNNHICSTICHFMPKAIPILKSLFLKIIPNDFHLMCYTLKICVCVGGVSSTHSYYSAEVPGNAEVTLNLYILDAFLLPPSGCGYVCVSLGKDSVISNKLQLTCVRE